jgi:hypothetical protein
MRGLGDGARFNSQAIGEHFAMNNRSPLDDGNHTCSLERRRNRVSTSLRLNKTIRILRKSMGLRVSM